MAINKSRNMSFTVVEDYLNPTAVLPPLEIYINPNTISFAYKKKINRFEGYILRYIGEVLLNVDAKYISDVEKWIRQAIEANRRNGMRFDLGKSYAVYAKLFKRKNDIPKAKENLSKTIEIFKECGADGWAEKYEKELTAL